MVGLDKVKVRLAVELGGRSFALGEVLGFSRGAAIDLDQAETSLVVVKAQGVAIARARLLPGAEGPMRIEVIEMLRRKEDGMAA